MLDMVILLEQPWVHFGAIVRMLQAHRAGGNACGVFSPVGTALEEFGRT